MKVKNSNAYDYDDVDVESLVRDLKRKGLAIEAFEILSGRHEMMISLEEQKLANPPVEEDYLMFLKSILLGIEPSSLQNEGENGSDEEDDPQYTIFLENLKKNGFSYKLEVVMGNRTVYLAYEGEDNSDDKHGIPSPITSKKVLNIKNVEDVDYQNIENKRRRVRDNASKETNLKPVETETRSSPRLCNNKLDIAKNKRNKAEIETQCCVERGLKSKAVKDLKNVPGKKVESPNFLKSVIKYMENTKMDTKENSKSEKRKLGMRDMKTGSGKTNGYRDKRSGAKWSSVLGRDWQRELNADDVEESYVVLLNSGKVVGDRFVYVDEGQKPVECEALDVECSSDSEVVETPINELQHLRSGGRGEDSVFRKQLMAKLGEPYDYEEYKNLWNEIKLERPKIKHYDLRGSRSAKPFHTEELSPSYLSTYAPLRMEIAAVGHDRRRRLNYLRGFFFWLKNVAHEDAFEPWLDKACLEVMRKSC